ncbi:DNA polymerase beta domain-containing protein region [Methanolobus psychrophilus R15]|nr:DNA polymerase beta domain-containing protein region [Methanolobus psychrophilus R15]
MDVLGILREHENVIMERFDVKKVGVFGSFARGEEHEDSDVDILVEFKEGQRPLVIIWNSSSISKNFLEETWTLSLRLP